MANTVLLSPIFNDSQFFTNLGVTLNGGQIITYLAGTTTPANTYTSNTGNILQPNPIVLDSNGRLQNPIWLLSNVAYKMVLTDSANNQLGQPFDNVEGADTFTQSTALGVAQAAYAEANSAYALANAIIAPAEASYAQANASANTVAVYANGSLILANANLNFNNTSTINVSITANGTNQTNIAFSANTSAQTSQLTILNIVQASNGYAEWGYASNGTVVYIEQWGQAAFSSAGVTVNFPIAFPSLCFNIQATREVSAGYDAPGMGIQYGGRSSFTGFVGSAINTVFFWRANGF